MVTNSVLKMEKFYMALVLTLLEYVKFGCLKILKMTQYYFTQEMIVVISQFYLMEMYMNWKLGVIIRLLTELEVNQFTILELLTE